MKRTLLGVLLIWLIFSVRAQQPVTKTPKYTDSDVIPEPQRDTVPVNGLYKSVEQEPTFPGGWKAFYKFLARNVKYPKSAGDVYGKVFIQFIVEKNGRLSHIHVIRSLGPEFDAEATRVMKLSPKWKAGVQNGRTARVQYAVPINFTLLAN
ncbi:MAG TPA: energy transducer TonB [Mucilaginibacter sp.]|nr:energy transducer TonB [Mucilaginibacter sp.]